MEETRVTLEEVLQARDARAARQRRLRAEYGLPLICFTMNIPGPVKYNALIERGFRVGMTRIEDALEMRRRRVVAREEAVRRSGCEAVWVVDAAAAALKEWMTAIEEADALGRLFDIDVLDADGTPLSRAAERRCLICGGPVRSCARSRSHPVEALFERTQQILRDCFADRRAAFIGACAQRALMYEALVTPKPGLVDRENGGAHADMDIFSFAASASALGDWFVYCARTGLACPDGARAFERLRVRGAEAEREMYRATNGANTHKGAIFALGLLCCAAGMVEETAEAQRIARTAARLAAPAMGELRGLDGQRASTGGERQFLECGLPGARGEAAAGFPQVLKYALPALAQSAAQGKDANEAGLAALLALLPRVQDSNILRRRGMAALRWVQGRARALGPEPSRCALRELDSAFVRENISPGGSADLLAAAYFLYFVTGGTFARGGLSTCLRD